MGPVISEAREARLAQHAAADAAGGDAAVCLRARPAHADGQFFPPHLFELRALDQLRTEEFGPILHVARFRAGELPQVLRGDPRQRLRPDTGRAQPARERGRARFRALPVGNTYVNRNMIGAVVGVQPFGGQGLSGTGPKAGGPHYLLRFATERTLTINTVAIGGNVELLS